MGQPIKQSRKQRYVKPWSHKPVLNLRSCDVCVFGGCGNLPDTTLVEQPPRVSFTTGRANFEISEHMTYKLWSGHACSYCETAICVCRKVGRMSHAVAGHCAGHEGTQENW